MKFDYCISNPAFNIAVVDSNDKPTNIAGTGGNTTLYRTATRHDFDTRLKDGGTLINITLKGIIPDLVSGHFSAHQVDYINLMDDIEAWTYNTCFFAVTKKPRSYKTQFNGGLAAKIYSPYSEDCFPFVYNSGSNNSMNRLFNNAFSNRVVRQLPGKNRDNFVYDYTNANIPHGPKFAFYVMESKKSYTVTEEPLYGGTICYIPTQTIEEAQKLRLFVEKNAVFKEYVQRMKLRGHAFSMRNVRKFDINQIVTGYENPAEWNIVESDLEPPKKINNEISKDRNRIKALGEVFTPTDLVNIVLDNIQTQDFNDPKKTFIDSMCGDGQFLVEILKRKLKNGIDHETALHTIFGIDIMPDNVKMCQDRLLCGREDLRHIVEKNIVCADSLEYNYLRNEDEFGPNGMFRVGE